LKWKWNIADSSTGIGAGGIKYIQVGGSTTFTVDLKLVDDTDTPTPRSWSEICGDAEIFSYYERRLVPAGAMTINTGGFSIGTNEWNASNGNDNPQTFTVTAVAAGDFEFNVKRKNT
jgi:hypothetical protein